MKSAGPELQAHLRLCRDGQRLFGPGKVELLHYIAATGSIRTAAAEMDMSYQRAWTLVREVNDFFIQPLVVVSRGGGTGGGAALTATGRTVLALYAGMQETCRTATREQWTALRQLLK